jgi:hypothetical protein
MKKILFLILFPILVASQNPIIKYNIIHFEIPITNISNLEDALENHPNIEKKSDNKYFFSRSKVNKRENGSWFLTNEEIYFDIKITDRIEVYNIRFSNSIQINLGYASTSMNEKSLETYAVKNNGELRMNKTFTKNYECLHNFFKETLNQ